MAWVTSLPVSKDNVAEIVAPGAFSPSAYPPHTGVRGVRGVRTKRAERQWI